MKIIFLVIPLIVLSSCVIMSNESFQAMAEANKAMAVASSKNVPQRPEPVKRLPAQQTPKEAYIQLLHQSGLAGDTCGVRVVLDLLDRSIDHLTEIKPTSDARLDSARLAIISVYNKFNRAQRDNSPFVLTEKELEKRLAAFIDIVFNKREGNSDFWPPWAIDWFNSIRGDRKKA